MKTKIRAVVVEDDKNDLKRLMSSLEKLNSELEVVGICSEVDLAIQKIAEVDPDLVFLDIELGDRRGFEILDFQGELKYNVIFTTSHVNYAINAFDANAVHYLHKPIQEDKVIEAIDRYKKRTKSQMNIATELLSIRNAIQLMQSPPTNDTRVRLEIRGEVVFRTLGEISFFEADGDLAKVYFSNGDRLTEDRGLKKLSDNFRLLPFTRVHKSYMINPYNIQKFTNKDGAHFSMKGFDGSVPLGRAYKLKVKSDLGLK